MTHVCVDLSAWLRTNYRKVWRGCVVLSNPVVAGACVTQAPAGPAGEELVLRNVVWLVWCVFWFHFCVVQ